MSDAPAADIDRAPAAEPRPEAAAAWHALSAADALDILKSGPNGLSAQEARRRLDAFGPNRLPEPERTSGFVRFARQFDNVLIYVLLGACAVTLALREWTESGVILGVVVINAVIGFLQEGRAERAMDAIRRMLSLDAVVVRDGARATIPAEQVAPGDLALLEAGDKVPADLRLVSAKGLAAEEAILTGESAPVDKDAAARPADAALGDRASMLYAGTMVTRGQAAGVVVATGARTEIGRIGALLSRVDALDTPLMRQIARFGRVLSALILALAAVVFAVGWLVQEIAPPEMFLAAVALAVAAIPEGMPAIVTIILAIGVQRMARRNAIVRRLPAVETLGAVSVICADKTGTLTHNEMMAASVASAGRTVRVGGDGYRPEGAFEDEEGAALDPAILADVRRVARAGLLCNDAVLREHEGGWVVDGDPMEGALIALAAKAGLDVFAELAERPRLDAQPFSSETRFMATLHGGDGDAATLVVKGAPERVLAMCDRERTDDGDQPLRRPFWEERIDAFASGGQRVLAVAARALPKEQRWLDERSLRQGLCLQGLVGLADPPRRDAIEAVARCRRAGVDVKMITGDHAETARSVARAFGLATNDVVGGAELDRLDADDFAAASRSFSVFARTAPEHKLRLVEALQAGGAIVAMTGDGVNDAPALKRADIGVAMGRRGSEAAKEAAQIVLADDNFTSIADAVEEGRAVYANLQKAVLYLLATNGAQAMTVALAVVAGLALPITPLQILWVNMVTAVTLALALAFERAEPDVMARPPRPPNEPLVDGRVLARLAVVTVPMVAGVFAAYEWMLIRGASLEAARTAAVNTLVVFEIFYLLNVRSGVHGSFGRDAARGAAPALIAIALVLALQIAFTYAPWLQFVFATTPLGLGEWAAMAAAGALLFVLIELEKAALRAIGRRGRDGPGRA